MAGDAHRGQGLITHDYGVPGRRAPAGVQASGAGAGFIGAGLPEGRNRHGRARASPAGRAITHVVVARSQASATGAVARLSYVLLMPSAMRVTPDVTGGAATVAGRMSGVATW
ncbi:hypothetical protein Adu01nite_27470 [Paractinoplanes durhamensis]|uniref:Uncharacterized protein n=1 Tax=Paractinoplanes durhamensis TaxID=113563 RepID=A0ABQ3YUX6_9ACTN|nr:hypothetical protein Adu01nite_27470 [Actinoplanes durhamensis]